MRGEGPREAAAGPASRDVPDPGYSLLAPPNYDQIVGGTEPSPYASVLLVLGLALIVAAAAATGFGWNAAEWWALGALFGAVACFLAAFVSRRA